MTQKIRDAFRAMAASCGRMGSPFMQSLLAGLADGLTDADPVGAKVLNWPGDPSGMADAVPLRLAGGLHALVLTGQDPVLAAAYIAAGAGMPAREAPLPPSEALALTEAALAALPRNEAFLLRWLDSAPQTNEVRRSIGLIAAGHWLTARYGLPLVLSELGCSAGLNMLWDHYALVAGNQRLGPDDAALTLTPDWQGLLPPRAQPRVQSRAGVDLNPLDPVTDRPRLLAYLWPDQPDRLARTSQALDLAALLRPKIAKGDAIDWLETRLQTRDIGAVHVVYHTVAWQYLPAAAQDRGRVLLAAAGAEATPDAPLVHLSMETDDASPGEGAGLSMTLWPDGQTIAMARVDFHGRWLRWTTPPPRHLLAVGSPA